MVWKVEFQADAERDLGLVFDHLFETYKNLGESDAEAIEHAAERVSGIQESAIGLSANPYRGTVHEAFGRDVRNVTINRAIIWFQLDETDETIRILAFFFGGQDHIRHMLTRLLGGPPE